jgi:hypothetical protein
VGHAHWEVGSAIHDMYLNNVSNWIIWFNDGSKEKDEVEYVQKLENQV